MRTGGWQIHVTYDRCDFLLYGTLLLIFFGWWPVTSRCNRSSGFVAPRTSWGSWRALGELWGFLGAPWVGFGTFWGDLGSSHGGVQWSRLGGEYVKNTYVLELGRFSVTCGGGPGFSLFFHCFFERGFCGMGRWIHCKIEGFAIGPYVKFKNIMIKMLVSGGELWAPNITKII